jgi:hypothetical protein
MSFSWEKIGSISTPGAAASLRFTLSYNNSGKLSYFNGSEYRDIGFFHSGNTFNSSIEYSQSTPGWVGALPTSGIFYLINGAGSSYDGLYIKKFIPEQVYTIVKRINSGTGSYFESNVYGFDSGDEDFISYSYHYEGSGGTGSLNTDYFAFGPKILPFYVGAPRMAAVEPGFSGKCCISRNGQFAAVEGLLAGQKTIKVYTSQNGYPGNVNPIVLQIGGNIQIPGTENISEVKINNAGTRLVAYTFSNIYTYELISGSWEERPALASPASNSGTGISLCSAGNILVTRGNIVANSYLWDTNSNSWQLVDQTALIAPLSYVGRRIDMSGDAKYMAVDVWPTTNSTAIEIYSRIDNIPLYKGAYAESIYYGSSVPNSIYYGSTKLWP